MEKQIVEYSVTDAAIREMETQYMGLTVLGLDDKEGFELVHDARMVVRGTRIEVEKKRKELKVDALEWGRTVDSEAKRIFKLIEPIESHLQFEEEKITKEKERIQAEELRLEQLKTQSRVDSLMAYNVVLPYMDVATMDDDTFENLRQRSEEAWSAEKARLADEEARLAEERIELARKADEQAERDEALQKKEDALRVERETLEREKRDAEEKKDREAFELKAKEDAKILAEKETKDKADREARELKEKEEADKAETIRQEKLCPDKEKLIAWAEAIASLCAPEVQDEKAKAVVFEGEKNLMRIATEIRRNGEEM